MTDSDAIPKTYEDAVRVLARWHAEAQGNSITVYSFPDPAGQAVRLVEVSDDFPETGSVAPVRMGRSKDFPFESCVALVTPAEWERVVSGQIELPEGWDLASQATVWPR